MKPKSLDEAVEILLKELPCDARDEISSMKEDDLIQLHFGLGMAIRNKFGLWEGNTRLLAALGQPHPDDASMIIIRALWKRLKGKDDGQKEHPIQPLPSAAE